MSYLLVNRNLNHLNASLELVKFISYSLSLRSSLGFTRGPITCFPIISTHRAALLADDSPKVVRLLVPGLPVQIAFDSAGRRSSGCALCPPAGNLFHPPRGNKHTDFHHQTERSTYLEAKGIVCNNHHLQTYEYTPA